MRRLIKLHQFNEIASDDFLKFLQGVVGIFLESAFRDLPLQLLSPDLEYRKALPGPVVSDLKFSFEMVYYIFMNKG